LSSPSKRFGTQKYTHANTGSGKLLSKGQISVTQMIEGAESKGGGENKTRDVLKRLRRFRQTLVT